MEYLDNTICLTYKEMLDCGIPMHTIKNLRSRKKLRQERRACKGVHALYSLDSLPLQYKVQVYERYPDLKEREKSKPFVEEIELNAEALAYYTEYTFDGGRHLSEDKIREYTHACSVLDSFGRKIEVADGVRLSQSHPRLHQGNFWIDAANALKRIKDAGWIHNLPDNHRSLQRKYNRYKKEGYESMINKNYQNKYAAKIVSDEQKRVLLSMLSLHINANNQMVADEYNKIAKLQGWSGITSRAVGCFREEYAHLVDYGRLGATKYRNERLMQVKRYKPTTALAMWSLDGWTAELLYQARTKTRKGQSVTTYTNRLTLEVVLDPSCDYPIGYAIGDHESKDLIRAALRNALQHTRELFGTMYRTAQIQCDHYALDRKLEGDLAMLYKSCCDKLVPAKLGNAKSKPIEHYFTQLNENYCRRCGNWSGHNVTSKPDNQPNSDALNQLRKFFPNRAEVIKQLEAIIAEERRLKRDQFIALYEAIPEEQRLPMPRKQYLLHFGEETGYTNRMQGKGLCPTLLGKERVYDTFEQSFRTHRKEDWTVLYDRDDLSNVLVVNKDKSLRYLLEAKYEQPMALQDRVEGDAEELQRVFDFNEAMEAEVKETLIEAHRSTEKLIAGHSEMKSLLGRLLIVDSKGNHKDRRSEALAMADVEDVEEIEEEIEETPSPRERKSDNSFWEKF